MLGKLRVRAAIALAACFLLPAGASAASFVYALKNHPVPGSGMRLDGLGSGDGNDVFTFDFDDAQSSVSLVYDDGSTPGVLGDDSVRIFGTVFGGLLVAGSYDPQVSGLWTLDFTYTAQITSTGGDGSNIVVGAEDPANAGTITPLFDAPAAGLPQGVPIPLVDEQGNFGFSFKFNNTDDHRLAGTGLSGPTTLVGWGWLNHSGVEHIKFSDWLFIGVRVPEPGLLLLLGGLGLAPRLRRSLATAAARTDAGSSRRQTP